MKTLTAHILDSHSTPGELVIDFPDNHTVAVPLVEYGENGLEECLPALVEALRQAGYAFLGEPTSDAGPVRLVEL